MKISEMIKLFLEQVGQGYGQEWVGLIVFERHEYRAQWAQMHMNQLLGHWAKFNRQHNVFHWESGERLDLGVIREVNDYHTYHGRGYPFIAIVGETHRWPRNELRDRLRCLRRPGISAIEPFMNFVSIDED